MEVILDEVLDVLEQAWQVELGGLAATAGKGVQAGNAGTLLLEGFAERVAPPAKQALGLTLAQGQSLQGLGHVATARGADLERARGLLDEGA